MQFGVFPFVQTIFRANYLDWCLGGPRAEGFTRYGDPQVDEPVALGRYSFGNVSVEDVLAKNREETQSWHVSFLQHHPSIEDTIYYQEYLKPRYGDESLRYARSFLDLYESVRRDGVRKAVWLADVEDLQLGFRYFRFDGCHRACAAHVAGYGTIAALVFKTVIFD